MKKTILFTLLVAALCMPQVISAKRIDTITGEMLGLLPTEVKFEYDADNNISKIEYYVTFDSEIIEDQGFTWGDGTPIEPGSYLSGYYEYEYDKNGNISDFGAWFASFEKINAFDLEEKIGYTYNPDGTVATEIDYLVDSDTGGFVQAIKNEYTYDGSGNLISDIAYSNYDKENDRWLNSRKTETEIDPDDKTFWTVREYEDYDGTGWAFKGYEFLIVKLNADNRIEEKIYHADEERLYPARKITYDYDEDGNVIVIKNYDYATDTFILTEDKNIYYPSFGLPKLVHAEFRGEDGDYNHYSAEYNESGDVRYSWGHRIVFDEFDADGYPAKVEVIEFEDDFEDPDYTYAETIADFTITYHADNVSINPVMQHPGRTWAEQGTLFVETEKAAHLLIYDINGKILVKERVDAGKIRKKLPAGVYIVVINDFKYKVQVP